jgi:ribosomal protein L13E
MANGGTPDPGRRGDDHPSTRRLRELAAQEAAVTKQRLATRTAAARVFFGALARLAEAKAAWRRAEAEARRAQAEAVEGLVGSGLQLGEVAELLGISNREARTLGAATPARPKRTRPSNERAGSVAATSLVSSPAKLGENGALRQAEPPVGDESGGPGGPTRRLPLQ